MKPLEIEELEPIEEIENIILEINSEEGYDDRRVTNLGNGGIWRPNHIKEDY